MGRTRLVRKPVEIAAADGSDYDDLSYLAMSVGSTGQAGAVDVDFLSWTSGVVAPVPEPGTLTLLLLAVLSGGLLVRRRRRAT